MYTLVRRYVKTAIVFLALGLALGFRMLVARELGGRWPHPYMVSAHVHAVLVGFVMFLILGVALWLFPRAPKDDTRYRPERIEAAYWILTFATGGRLVGEVARVWADGAVVRWWVVLCGAGQAIGIGLYFWAMWPRIRPVGSHLREARGEKF